MDYTNDPFDIDLSDAICEDEREKLIVKGNKILFFIWNLALTV